MARTKSFSPTLLMIGALAVLGGSAAALLGVGGSASVFSSSSTAAAIPLPYTFDFLFGLPVAALVGVTIWSLVAADGGSIAARGAYTAIALVILLLISVVIVFHSSIFPKVPGTSDTGGVGTGGTGTGGRGGGSGSGSGPNSSGGGHSGGNGSGGSNGNGSGNNSTGHSGGGGNQSGGGSGGGTNSTGGGTGSGGSNKTSGGGSGDKNGTTGVSTRQPPPPASAWPVYVAGVALLLLLGAMIVPQLASRWAQRRNHAPPLPAAASPVAAAAAAQVLSDAAKRLDSPTDPRVVIVDLYNQLLNRLEPRVNIPTHRTPDEIRTAHLIPLGVRPEPAGQLTRLFEEACYSSHPLGADAASLARASIQAAERDLRAVHALG